MTIYMLYLVVYGDMKVASIVEKKMDSGYTYWT